MLPFNHHRIKKIFKYFTISIILLFIIFWGGLILYQKYLQNKTREESKITSPTGIDTLLKVNLGGIDQWCLIRGWDRSSPVLLYLHGGPGGPLFPRVRPIESFTHLEQHFVMVYWEQRGTAKSYHPNIPIETMTIRQFVLDIQELSRFLIQRFSANKIYLMGTSWGSLIGLLAAHETPEFYHAFVGVGQLVNPLENDQQTYQLSLRIAETSSNGRARKELESIGAPPYDYQHLITQRRWLTRFEKIALAEKGIKVYPEFNTVEKLLSTPEYSIVDILRMGRDPYFSLKHLWNEELYQIDLIREVPQINIPVYFLMGRHDYITPPALMEEYYQQLSAPKGKRLIWFEKSGHEPYFHEAEKFREVMVGVVLRETYSRKKHNGLME